MSTLEGRWDTEKYGQPATETSQSQSMFDSDSVESVGLERFRNADDSRAPEHPGDPAPAPDSVSNEQR